MPRRKLTLDEKQALCREYRIEFAGEISSSEWPESHKTILDSAKELGKKRYDTYATASPGNEPWKAQRKSHANVLVDIAKRQKFRNESTWRYTCEPFILSRLNAEVCCLEAVGINKIFNFRTDEVVHHHPQVTKALGDHKEKPDCIYGLRETRNIELLRYDISSEGRANELADNSSSEEHLLDQPMAADGDTQLFPFLVLEAKKGASSEWSAIDLQTAFSIRTFLVTQRKLFSTAKSRSIWTKSPLIWYFSNRGEDWRLCAAYTEDAPPRRDLIGTSVYRVIEIWRGCISNQDGALQLLLLVDYIFDWARDIYRVDIINALKIVAHGDCDSFSLTDSALHSVNPSAEIHTVHTSQGNDSYRLAEKAFLDLDLPGGAFRHAAFVDYRYYCLFVTEDNAETLVRSTSENRVRSLCRAVLRELKPPLAMGLQALDKIEEEWTGHSRQPLSAIYLNHPQAAEEFHVAMSFTTYLSGEWRQVRELSVIAIAGKARQILENASSLKRPGTHVVLNWFKTSTVSSGIQRLRAGSPQQTLRAAISRTCLRVTAKILVEEFTIDEDDDGTLRGIVQFLYTSFKKGSLEPDDPFLRFSQRLTKQNLFDTGVEPFQAMLARQNLSPLVVSQHGCVLIYAGYDPKEHYSCKDQPRVCAYFVNEDLQAPTHGMLAGAARSTFETCDIYHTSRGAAVASFSETVNKTGDSKATIWNISRTYGMCIFAVELAKFLGLFHQLGVSSPITQGSSRSVDSCGSQIYKRNIVPWIDRRFLYSRRYEQMFIIYKLFTREIEYWRSLANDRMSKGISCCRYCSTIQESEECQDCSDFLSDTEQYEWLRNAISGRVPIQLQTGLSSDEVKIQLHKQLETYPSLSEIITPEAGGYGTYDANADWNTCLSIYPELNKPYSDMNELLKQLSIFATFHEVHTVYGLTPSLKRKREEMDRADEGEASSNNDSAER